MNVRLVCKWSVVSILLALGSSFGLNKALFAQAAPGGAEEGGQVLTRGPADVEEGVQVLTRGPVHEAFAELVTFDPDPGIVVPEAPRA